MDLISRIDALPLHLQEIIGQHLPDEEYTQWRMHYRLLLPKEEPIDFFISHRLDENPLELANEMAAHMGRHFKSRKRRIRQVKDFKKAGILFKTHSRLQVDLFKILTQKPKALQRTLRVIKVFLHYKLVNIIGFKVWDKSWVPKRILTGCVPFDVFIKLVGPTLAKNPHMIHITFNRFSLTPAEKAEITPWEFYTKDIDPLDYEKEEED